MDIQQELENKEETLTEELVLEETNGDISEKPAKTNIRSILSEVLLYCIIFVLCVFIIPKYVIQKTIVDGDSMEPTLQNGNQLMVDKVSYKLIDPERFDVVVFYPYGKDVNEYYVKRIIGLPGETLQIKEPDIYINGERLEEHFGKDLITYAGIAEKPITLGEDEFFLLGDNREISLDSRYEEVGPVHQDMIAGRALIRVWPLSEFGTLPK